METTSRVARKGIITNTTNFNKNKYLLKSSSFAKTSNRFNSRKNDTISIVDSGTSGNYGPLSLDCIDTLPCDENM